MLELYFTQSADVYGELNKILSRHIPSPFEILRTEKGKPYIGGNPVFFSVSHSRGRALIAVCDRPVGADIEIISERNYASTLSRFCARERAEIACAADFLRHWVVREAYIKMNGETLAEKLKDLIYAGGILYDRGAPAECELTCAVEGDCVYSVCVDNKRRF